MSIAHRHLLASLDGSTLRVPRASILPCASERLSSWTGRSAMSNATINLVPFAIAASTRSNRTRVSQIRQVSGVEQASTPVGALRGSIDMGMTQYETAS